MTAAPVLHRDGRVWSLPDPRAEVSGDERRLVARWPDGTTLSLTAEPVAGGERLAAGCTVAPGTMVEGAGVRLRRTPAPGRILVDGYHSWDWAGVRDATAAGAGWWGGVWGDPTGGPAAPLAVRPAEWPPAVAVALRWAEPGILDVISTADPPQDGERTGAPAPFDAGPSGALTCAAVEIARLDRIGAGGAAVPAPPPGWVAGARPSGWMSWNCIGPAVTAADVRTAGRELVPPGGLVLLDDGWMPAWGDWVAHPEFGATLAELAGELRSTGRALGVWLAPFLAHVGSRLAAEHPELLLRDAGGDLVVDRRPSRPQHVLDGADPAAQQHLHALGARLGATGAAAVKLDFLYAGALRGRHAGGLSGVQALRAGLEAFVAGYRDAAPPGAAVLACGAPAPPVAGLVDSCRSGGDAVVNIPYPGSPRPSLAFAHGLTIIRAQERNLGARAWLWGATVPPDVDAVTLGAVGDMPPLEGALLETWLLLARRSGGPFLVSDVPAGLPADRLERLREELDRNAGGAGPWRPADPLGMSPAPMTDDNFYAWPPDLPGEWDEPPGGPAR